MQSIGNETFRLSQISINEIIVMMQAAEKDIPSFYVGKLQEMQCDWNKKANYKIARLLGNNGRELNKFVEYDDDYKRMVLLSVLQKAVI